MGGYPDLECPVFVHENDIFREIVTFPTSQFPVPNETPVYADFLLEMTVNSIGIVRSPLKVRIPLGTPIL